MPATLSLVRLAINKVRLKGSLREVIVCASFLRCGLERLNALDVLCLSFIDPINVSHAIRALRLDSNERPVPFKFNWDWVP